MYKKSKLSTAIVAAVASYTGSGLTNAADLEEIIVTATKRSESTQDVPVAVQALGGESLEALNVTSFDDYVKYLPNVTRGGRGPGQNEIYIRGMASDASTISVAEAQGSAPTVALYLVPVLGQVQYVSLPISPNLTVFLFLFLYEIAEKLDTLGG